MPLRDHFHPPLSQARYWEDFHGDWAYSIKHMLNRRILPSAYFAAAQVHVGSRVEVDVAAFEQTSAGHEAESRNGGVAVAIETWAPPVTNMVIPAVFPDEVEVQVFSTSGGHTLVAAIEFISPGNKDRRETRRAFVAKCASYLQQGIGLVIIDVVTERMANLHNELIDFLEQPPTFRFPEETLLYAASYRPSRRPTGDQIELWLNPIGVGQAMPTVPWPFGAVRPCRWTWRRPTRKCCATAGSDEMVGRGL
jgi:hypothetical protein